MSGTLRFLSFGAGVQTTATAILIATGAIPKPNAIVFADTGDESPETYAFLRSFARWMTARGLRFERVRRDGAPLVEWYTERALLPMRSRSSCTENWKILPVRRFMRQNGCATATFRSREKPRVQLGISWDEMERITASDVRWIVNEYPLIDLRLTRDDCKKIIAAAGFEVPPKSGCMCCPWQSERAIVHANDKHPERIERVAAMEDRAIAKHPGNRLIRADRHQVLSVRQILANAKRRIPLFDLTVIGESCRVAGYCFR